MTTVTALLTNKAYGYPTRGAPRRRKPTILACLHQTANAKATAMQGVQPRQPGRLLGALATAYIDRDGTIVRAIDPVKYAAWSQGDVAHPNTKLPTIAAAVASGVNLNEWVYESIECSGAGTEPYTDAQFEAVAHLVAAASRALGIPVNRSTVVVHADINSVSQLGPDQAELDRIGRERDRAMARFLRDRDMAALSATMDELDREERAARAPRAAEVVPADVAVRYLRDLPETWRKATGETGRQLVAGRLVRSDRRARPAGGDDAPVGSRGPPRAGFGPAGGARNIRKWSGREG